MVILSSITSEKHNDENDDGHRHITKSIPIIKNETAYHDTLPLDNVDGLSIIVDSRPPTIGDEVPSRSDERVNNFDNESIRPIVHHPEKISRDAHRPSRIFSVHMDSSSKQLGRTIKKDN